MISHAGAWFHDREKLKEAKQYKVSDEQYGQGAYIMLPAGWWSSS